MKQEKINLGKKTFRGDWIRKCWNSFKVLKLSIWESNAATDSYFGKFKICSNTVLTYSK